MISQHNFMKFYDFDHFSTKFDLDTTGRASDWRLARSTRTPGLLTHAESTKTHIHSTTENATYEDPDATYCSIHPCSPDKRRHGEPASTCASSDHRSALVQPELCKQDCTAKERAVVRAPGANTGG